MRPTLIAFGLLAFVYAFRPAAYDLWNPDEPKRAQVTREMMRSGEFRLLTKNGLPYFDKPPLWYWVTALVSWPVGDVTETTARLPSILAVLALFWMVRRRAGLLAAVILLTSPMLMIHPYAGRLANMDMLLCLLTTASVFAFWDRRTLLAGALCGLAILTKGPPGLLVPAIGFGAIVWAERRRIGPVFGALGIGLLVAAAWFIPAAFVGGRTFVDETLGTHIAKKIADPRSHQRPFWYFLTTLPMHFFPWIVLLPGAWWAARKRSDHPMLAACAVWALLTLLAFSLSGSKREIYLLPMFPPLAILVAAYLEREPRRTMVATVGATALAGVALALVAGGAIVVKYEEVRVPAAVTAAVLLASLAALRRVPVPAQAMTLAAFLALAGLSVHQSLFPALNPSASARPLADQMRSLGRSDERWVQVDLDEDALIYYADRFMDVHKRGAPGPGPMFGVATPEGLGRLSGRVEVLGRGSVGSDRDLLIFRRHE